MSNWWNELEVFEKTDSLVIKKGSIVMCPVIYMELWQKILDFDRKTDTDHDNIKWIINTVDFNKHFQNLPTKLPVHRLKLESSEEYLLNKAKLRPCLVLNIEDTEVKKGSDNDNNVKHLNNNSILLMPIYGLTDSSNSLKFHPDTTNRIRHLTYNKFIYFPKDDSTKKNCYMAGKEGFGRLDLAFHTKISHIVPKGITVTKDYMRIIDLITSNYLNIYFDQKSYEDEKIILEMIQEQYLSSLKEIA